MLKVLFVFAILTVLFGLGTVLKIIGTFVSFIFAIPILLIGGFFIWAFLNVRSRSKANSRDYSQLTRY